MRTYEFRIVKRGDHFVVKQKYFFLFWMLSQFSQLASGFLHENYARFDSYESAKKAADSVAVKKIVV